LSFLIYCVFDAGRTSAKPLPGIDGQPVFTVTYRQLAVAVSLAPPAALLLNPANIRTYGRVIAALHRRRTVVPMRFGCALADEAAIICLLAEHYGHYRTLLKELRGCVEMGIRLLLPAPHPVNGTALPEPGLPPLPADPQGNFPGAGWAYLRARKSQFKEQDRQAQDYRSIAAHCRAHFTGLCKKTSNDHNHQGGLLLSLDFLVPENSLTAFRQAFRTFNPTPGAKVLLSGPWPPYSFVMRGARAEGEHAGEAGPDTRGGLALSMSNIWE
jgi:hypothetical protein